MSRSYRKPPWPGNSLAEVHGAHSERRISPRVAEIRAALVDHPECPSWLHEPSYQPAVNAYCRAEAIVTLLWEYLDSLDVVAALSESAVSDEEEVRGKGVTTRHTVSRRAESVLNQIHRHETRAANLRAQLGLTPLARSRLGKLGEAPRVDIMLLAKQRFEEMDREGTGGR